MTGTNALTVVLVHGGFVDGAGWEGVILVALAFRARSFVSRLAGA